MVSLKSIGYNFAVITISRSLCNHLPVLLHWYITCIVVVVGGGGVMFVCVCVCVCSVAQSCPNFCDPMDYSPPGSSVHGIFQARILQRVAMSYSTGSSQSRDRMHVSFIDRQILYHCATWEAHIMFL